MLTAAAVGAGITIAAAIPVILAIPLFIYIATHNNEDRTSKLLSLTAIAFIASTVLWPRYAALFIPGLPSLNVQRITNAAMALTLIAALFTSKNTRIVLGDSFRSHPAFWLTLGLYLAFRVVSSVLSDEPYPSLYRLTQELLVHVLLVFVGVYIGAKNNRSKTLLTVIAFAIAINFLIATAEQIIGKNVFSLFLTPQNEYMAWALSEKVRDGIHRSKGIFDHPLTYAEFCALSAPLAIALLSLTKRSGKTLIFITATTIFAVLGVLLSGSRSGYLATAVAFVYFIVVTPAILIARKKVSLRAASFGAIASIFAAASVVLVVSYTYEYTLGSKAHSESDNARLEMLERGFDLLKDSPVYGHGVGRAPELIALRLTPAGAYTVDSLPVSIAVDSGAVALTCFLLLFVYCLRYRILLAFKPTNKQWLLSQCLTVSLLAILVFKLILSLLDNNHLMFLVLGLAVSRIGTSNVPDHDDT